MPIEYTLLQYQPCPIARCPKCGAKPFVPFIRGTIQRRKFQYFFWKPRPYCALICSACKEIVDYENPPKLVYDSEAIYAKEHCPICGGRLALNPVLITRHYPDGGRASYHRECYETFGDFRINPAKEP